MNQPWQNNPFYTHQPVLRFYAERCTGPILELGCGEGSTQLLHDVCAARGIGLVTMEHDQAWMERYRHLAGPTHTFVAVGPAASNSDHDLAAAWVQTLRDHALDQRNWGLVFIDQSPWDARTASMQLLKDHTDLVVIHDVDYFPEHGKWGRVLRRIQKDQPGLYDFRDQFRRFKLYYPPTPWCCDTGPPTLVATQRDEPQLHADITYTSYWSACPDP